MPDGPRERWSPVVVSEPVRAYEQGFSATNTSGLSPFELAALNRALERLMAAGMTEREGKIAIDHAVRVWLEPKDAGDADLSRLMKR